ncbi:hypothetical protein [Aureibacillus halotolerans]|uniref:Glycosyl transferase family 1 n=1 Tax=Aureibacillus halotolerans TaxID=1508390 RepID=A0A4R6TVC6_9BACI|nr:hypothetical protein [Aureibacillus halotolerans]TDQ37740.1 hypothetical protein EV213_112100 [Aureibacillus halotolerans]
MPHFVYYLSENSEVHARRGAIIIDALLERSSQCTITVVHGNMLALLERQLGHWGERVSFRLYRDGLSYKYGKDGFTIDVVEMRETYMAFSEKFPELVEQEAAFLKEVGADVVISDIEAVAFPAAKDAGIRSIGISNFTWHTVYSDLVIEDAGVLADAYEQMDKWFVLAGGHREPAWGDRVNAGWFGAPTQEKRIKSLRKRWFGTHPNKQVVYVNFGELMRDQRLPEEWTKHKDTLFVVSSGFLTGSENIVPVPRKELHPQDYLAACDWAMTVPDWQTVSNAVLSHVPMRLLGHANAIDDVRLNTVCVNAEYGSTHLIESTQGINDIPFVAPHYKHREVTNRLKDIIDNILEYT